MLKSIRQSFIVLLCSCFQINVCQSQDSLEVNPGISISAYAELYYTQDFNHPSSHLRPAFIYSHNRTGEISLNLAYLKASYLSPAMRANVALATGSYMHANYSAEPKALQSLYEANIGVRLSHVQNLWLDVGVMPSHIGAESAVGINNWTLTRGLAAENSPYFETGLKLGYTSHNERWYLALLYLNGWQRIQRIDGNNSPALGSQVTYSPNAGFSINYSTYVGNDKPDSIKQMRYFQNVYSTVKLNNHWALLSGFDVGLQNTGQDVPPEMYRIQTWYAPFLVVRYRPSEKISLAARAERYEDPNGVVIQSENYKGTHLKGYSLNLDCRISAKAMWRTEARLLNSKERIFVKGDGVPTNHNTSITTTLAISF